MHRDHPGARCDSRQARAGARGVPHGGSSATSSGSVRVNDGTWHTVRCERTSSSVTMWVDGAVTGRNRNPTGTIANTRPVTIAGKGNCDQVTITCDYFSGDIDYVKIETS